MIEIWKDVKGYEGLYQISDLGNVKSFISNKTLKPSKNNHGYLVVTFYKNNTKKVFKVHVLVAIHFLGHVPNGHTVVVDHKDNDKENNAATNLQLIDNRQNSSKDRKGHTSKHVGVYWYKARKKWCAVISIDRKNVHLGSFDNEEDAKDAYQNKLKELEYGP